MVVTISRKPYKGTLIDNVLENQCGGINIDQTRIGTKQPNEEKIEGRFPANVLFSKKTARHLPPIQGAGHWANCKITGYGDVLGEGSVEYYGVGEKDNSGGTVAKFFFIVGETK